jgi:hypothetical protein
MRTHHQFLQSLSEDKFSLTSINRSGKYIYPILIYSIYQTFAGSAPPEMQQRLPHEILDGGVALAIIPQEGREHEAYAHHGVNAPFDSSKDAAPNRSLPLCFLFTLHL